MIGVSLKYGEAPDREAERDVSPLWEIIGKVFFVLKLRIYFYLPLNGKQAFQLLSLIIHNSGNHDGKWCMWG